jgi:DNA-binding MarR family transcriptional regulator
MKTARLSIDPYVVDVLMPDLIGHDRRPAAFLVYLFLYRHARRDGAAAASLQTIATRTGLSKSSVQNAIRHLKRRGLLDPDLNATTEEPVRRVLEPWLRPARP